MTAAQQPSPLVHPCLKCKALFFVADLNEKGKCSGCSSNKYHAKPTTVNGRRYPSIHEATVVEALYHRENQGEITNLRRQVKYTFVVNGMLCPTTYRADAVYEENGSLVVVDAKGVRTRDYVLKRWLMKVCHNIDIVEL